MILDRCYNITFGCLLIKPQTKGPQNGSKTRIYFDRIISSNRNYCIAVKYFNAISKKSKQIAQAVVCSAHTKQLTLAWQLYSNDYDGKICNGSISNNNYGASYWVQRIAQNGDPGYVAGMSILEREKLSIRNGTLFPYAQNESLYHCPSDPTFKKFRGATTINSRRSPYRTFAITGSMNGGTHFSIEPLKKVAQITSTSSTYVFVEEADEGKNGHNFGSWIMNPDPTDNTWHDPISVWHNMSSVFGFADGHAETHKWRNESTKDLSDGTIGTNDVVNPTDDLRWMQKGYISRR